MGIELFDVDPSVLKNPATSYISSKVTMSTNQTAAKLQSEYQCPSDKVTPILHWKDKGDDAETNPSSWKKIVSLTHLHFFIVEWHR
jgi:hypothetical protein